MDQGEETRALDRYIQLTLVFGLRSRDARWNDLAVFVHKFLQDADVFVIDLDNFFCGEAAEFLAAEKAAIGITCVFLVLVELLTAGAWTGHDLPLAKFKLGDVQYRHWTETIFATQKTFDGNVVAFFYAVHFFGQLTKRHGVHFDFNGNFRLAFALCRLMCQ